MVVNRPFGRVLRTRDISKRFAGVRALECVNLSFNPGQVTALVGENGAGKSTLLRILSGLSRPNTGAILLDDTELHLRSPGDALRYGIALIPQEVHVASSLDGVANVLLGDEPTRFGVIRTGYARQRAADVMARAQLHVPLVRPVRELDVREQRTIEILRGLARDAAVLIFDEASASLGLVAMRALRRAMRLLADNGHTIIFVSHSLDEVLETADRIIVMRDGKVVDEPDPRSTTPAALTELMLGRPLSEQIPERARVKEGGPLLIAKALARGRIKNFNLTAKQYEIVGIFGAGGAGGAEIARILAGVDTPDMGQLHAGGRVCKSQKDFIAAGIGFVPNDRKREGLLLDKSVAWNLSLPDIRRHSLNGLVSEASIARSAQRIVEKLSIRVADLDVPVRTLSGGNQQKIVIGRWLSAGAHILVLDEATKGIDVSAKRDVFKALREFADAGGLAIYVSTEAHEVAALCDRALVVAHGRAVAECVGTALTERALLEAAHDTREKEIA